MNIYSCVGRRHEYGFEVDKLKVCKHSTDKKGNTVYVIYTD